MSSRVQVMNTSFFWGEHIVLLHVGHFERRPWENYRPQPSSGVGCQCPALWEVLICTSGWEFIGFVPCRRRWHRSTMKDPHIECDWWLLPLQRIMKHGYEVQVVRCKIRYFWCWNIFMKYFVNISVFNEIFQNVMPFCTPGLFLPGGAMAQDLVMLNTSFDIHRIGYLW